MINATHYIIDLETMGKGSNAAIAAIGCVEIIGGTFSREIYRRVELSNSMSAGGITDADTIQWWLRQSAAARAEVDGTQPAELLFNVLGELRVFMTSMAHAHEILVWGNGATFDNVILSNAYAAYGMERPGPTGTTAICAPCSLCTPPLKHCHSPAPNTTPWMTRGTRPSS